MTSTLVHLLREALLLALWLVGPVLLTSLVTGLVSAAFQATTALHDPTVSNIPRLVAGTFVLIVCAPWAAGQMLTFTAHVYAWMAQGHP